MEITINDDAFIDLIHAVTADEIANLDSRMDDIESGGYADQDDLDEVTGSVEDLDDRMDALETRIEEVAEPSDEVTDLIVQISELEYQLELAEDAIVGLKKRTDYLMARTLSSRARRYWREVCEFASRVHWHSPFLR